eukprot:TRINITY_DN1558_c0_g1_i2.p1 TRINITY_DN1558_c0_g1~~TRINITY_DN1558_c0_g1_i2.p1  ORF type:complete len:125 (-),score=23.20 TRINITY_DN1558_c0_g1_i2:353-727(-)
MIIDTKIDEMDGNDMDYDEIMHQLLQFGYNENEIMEAMNMVTDKSNINDIVQCIENGINCQLNDEIEEKLQTIEHLELVNIDHEMEISKLERRVKLLRQQNDRLSQINAIKHKTQSCFSWFLVI